MGRFILATVLPILVLLALGLASNSSRRLIQGGEFIPLYGISEPDQKVRVGSFELDSFPVTNEQYYRFASTHNEWRASKASSLLADRQYLKHWTARRAGSIAPKSADLHRPVVNVSWFAASDFCRSLGGRLPTILEWEYAAAANETMADASRDPEFVQRLLDWYAAPSGNGSLREVGKSAPNFWGVYDLHGLVWEWTADFNSAMVLGDSRRDGDQSRDLFCGGGAVSAGDRANYAAFMRYALRNSLSGDYTMENLGFRCAYDVKGVLHEK